jgi:hypothetical protein
MSARLFTAVVFTGAATFAGPAAAAVNLVSADITQETWSTGSPRTVTGPSPFPNDTQNFAGVGEDGLNTVVNLTGRFSHAVGNFLNESYTNQQFRIVFQLDEPEPFTFKATSDVYARGLTQITLQAEGQPPVPFNPFFDTTGTLAAGLYTYSGAINGSGGLGYTGDRFFSNSVSFRDMRLTVVPEPGALALLGAGTVLVLRRRRSR